MIKVLPICQEHPEVELRQEFLIDENDRGYTSGYCSKCAKHYRLCSKTQYMNHCILRQGHDGHHTDGQGCSWDERYQKR